MKTRRKIKRFCSPCEMKRRTLPRGDLLRAAGVNRAWAETLEPVFREMCAALVKNTELHSPEPQGTHGMIRHVLPSSSSSPPSLSSTSRPPPLSSSASPAAPSRRFVGGRNFSSERAHAPFSERANAPFFDEATSWRRQFARRSCVRCRRRVVEVRLEMARTMPKRDGNATDEKEREGAMGESQRGARSGAGGARKDAAREDDDQTSSSAVQALWRAVSSDPPPTPPTPPAVPPVSADDESLRLWMLPFPEWIPRQSDEPTHGERETAAGDMWGSRVRLLAGFCAHCAATTVRAGGRVKKGEPRVKQGEIEGERGGTQG